MHQKLIESQNTLTRESLASKKLHPLKPKNDSHVLVCGENVNIPSLSLLDSRKNTARNTLVVIGHDKMNHVQTNNKLNAILHAMDYVDDINATLALTRNGWSTETLKLLFNQNDDERTWERLIESSLNLVFVDGDNLDHDILIQGNNYVDVQYNNSDDMYFYHTTAPIEKIIKRRQPVLQYLWTHPTTTTTTTITTTTRTRHKNEDMCSVMNKISSTIESTHDKNDVSLPKSFTVIHSRWMKNNGCLNRLGALAHRIHNMTGIAIDRKAPCLLQPRYIESILKKSNMLGKPIYIITDGLNNDIYDTLKSDPYVGQNVHLSPKEVSWVGSDMMLGVLSDCFIGTPISTLSGNVARARIALGKDVSTNYLFPLKRGKEDDPWDFACQNDNDAGCLYDVQILSHYVG